MDIPNLSKVDTTNNLSDISTIDAKLEKIKPLYIAIIAVLGIFISFWLSRFFPSNSSQNLTATSQEILSADQISSAQDIQTGKVYGYANGNFTDIATGILEKGSINGVGTHILNREGGPSQRASLTSSVVDLDMFVGKQVEIKGETNTSDKTSWFLDVGTIKVLQ